VIPQWIIFVSRGITVRGSLSPAARLTACTFLVPKLQDCSYSPHSPGMPSWHIDRQIELHWVRALTVPMHLCLTDRLFVSHNLISAQKSPLLLPKFQMAPKFKIVTSYESKKGTQIHYPFHSKRPGKRIPSRFPIGAPMKRDTCLQGIFTSLLIHPFYLSLKVPSKGAPSMFPKGVPMDRDTPPPEPLVYLSPARLPLKAMGHMSQICGT